MNDYISYLKADRERDLQHFGVKRRSGRYPWGSGERPFQSGGKGGMIKRGTKLSRLSLVEDENIKGVRKYVSVGKTEKKWKNLFQAYKDRGFPALYEKSYEAVKDIKVASAKEEYDGFVDWFNSDPIRLMYQLPVNIDIFFTEMGTKKTQDITEDFFKQLGGPFKENAEFLKSMHDRGYDAVVDIFGIQSGGDNSIIILNPDEDLKLKKNKKLKWQK